MFPDTEKDVGHLLSVFERIAAFFTWFSFSVLHLFEMTTAHNSFGLYNLTAILLGFLIFILFSIYCESIASPQMLASTLYILAYMVIYYYPDFFDIKLESRTDEDRYLLAVAFLFIQSMRPGRLPGIPVFTFLLLHVIYIQQLSHNHPTSVDSLLHILFFFWAGIMVLFIESLVHFTIIGYVDLSAKKKSDEEDLKLARRVYDNLFPDFRENEYIRISSHHQAVSATGGDFFDVIRLREKNIGIFVTDISGHGISSAIMSAAVKGIVTGLPYRYRLNPELFLTGLDQDMTERYGSHHATAVYIFFDFHSHTVRMANAGHCPVLFSQKGKPFREIETHGSILGFKLSSPIAREKKLRIQNGDRFLVYTDGLTEYMSMEGGVSSYYEIESLLDGLEHLQGDELLQTAIHRVKSRNDFVSFRDDVMVLVIEVKNLV